jgi:hypothetical protein
MSLALPAGFHWDEKLRLGRETAALTALVWPRYLVEESDIPEPGLKFEITREELERRFPAWGIRRDSDRKLVAFANGVHLFADFSKPLPSEGWRFAIQSAGTSASTNCLCLLVANIDPSARGLGFSKILIARAKQAALESGFQKMIAPVRPTLKALEPFVAMEEYVRRRSEKGGYFDPWLEVHSRSGGSYDSVCGESVKIVASLGKWRAWTGLSLCKNGPVAIPDGVSPLKVDVQAGVGIYQEPNVWFRYDL